MYTQLRNMLASVGITVNKYHVCMRMIVVFGLRRFLCSPGRVEKIDKNTEWLSFFSILIFIFESKTRGWQARAFWIFICCSKHGGNLVTTVYQINALLSVFFLLLRSHLLLEHMWLNRQCFCFVVLYKLSGSKYLGWQTCLSEILFNFDTVLRF